MAEGKSGGGVKATPKFFIEPFREFWGERVPNKFTVWRYVKHRPILRHAGEVSKDPLNGTWANSKSVRVFKTRQAAAENLL